MRGRWCSDLGQILPCSGVRDEIAEELYIWDAKVAYGHQDIAEQRGGRGSKIFVTRRSARLANVPLTRLAS